MTDKKGRRKSELQYLEKERVKVKGERKRGREVKGGPEKYTC